MSFSFSLARRALPDETCPTTPRNEAEARQQPSTGANLQGSCVLVGQETSPAEIPATNRFLGLCGEKIDSIEYYTEKINELTPKLEAEQKATLTLREKQ
ncbi:hypothetical protein ACFX2C_004691 [Malus domestica]